MTVVSIREITPFIGKSDLAKSRVMRAAGVMSRHGADVRVTKVVAGDGSGDIHIYGSYSSFETAAETFQNFSQDTEMLAIQQERELNPAADVRGPWLGRMIYGTPPSSPKPISVQRDYHMPRTNLSAAMELAPELDKLMDPLGVDVAVGVPVMGSDHEMMRVIYRFSSMGHWGKSVDSMVDNKEFSALVEKANSYGTLRTSRMIATI